MTLLENLGRHAWTPRRRLDALEFASKHVILGKRYTRRPGPYDVSYTPFWAEPHRWFSDPRVRSVTGAKGAQLGGTTWIANCMMQAIVEDPGPILYVTSNKDVAKSWSERELIPRFQDCEPIKALMPDNSDDFRRDEMHFRTCTLKLTGSNSEANLASRPVRYLFCDEMDKWPDEREAEAPAAELAEARTIAFKGIEKIIRISTPTIETGAIWSKYLAGTQHKYFVPCPFCGEYQVLEFKTHDGKGGIRWPDHHRDLVGDWNTAGVAKDAWYQCQHCEAHIPQIRQKEMVLAGDWRPTNHAADPAHISFHISSLYSPEISWGDLAKIFLEKKDTEAGLHDFNNNYLGLPWERRAAVVKEDALLALRDPGYRLGTLPVVPRYISLCADGHQTFWRWSIEARLESGENWLLDYGTTLTCEEILPLLDSKVFTAPDGSQHRITCGLIDSGYAADTVYKVCSHSNSRLYPCKGSTASFGTWSQSRLNDGKGILYTFVDYTAKTALYLDSIQKKRPPLKHWPVDVGRDFISEHMGQKMVETRTTRGADYEWKKVTNDHWGDCSKMHIVVHWVLTPHLASK